MELIYICNGIGSVFYSQVISLINEIIKSNYFENVTLLLGLKNESDLRKFERESLLNKAKVQYFRSYPNYPFYNHFFRKSLFHAIEQLNLKESSVIFHVRGEQLAWYLFQLYPKFRDKILVDIRGVSREEILEYFKGNKIRKLLKVKNYENSLNGMRQLKNISVVSESLKKYLIESFKFDESKITINHSLAGERFKFDLKYRNEIRKQLGLETNEVLFLFSSGGTANWQNIDIVEKIAALGFKILNLSPKHIKEKNVINKFVPYNEVIRYLSAADIAILWRDKSLTNKVASPVKFSEYLCCGLPIVANNSVELVTTTINKYHCGLIVDEIRNLNSHNISYLLNLNRDQIAAIGRKKFGIKNIAIKYKDIYDDMMNYKRK